MAGLYIHIPFCASKCSYCDFYSMSPRVSTDDYIDALLCEYRQRKSEISEPFTTIYIGGGTPSLLTDSQLRKLVEGLALTDIDEFTIEVNPDDVNAQRVEAWKLMGINRVSMGIQSFDDAQLSAIGRRHTSVQAISAVNDILNGGISNLSCDLIYGLPRQDVESWRISLRRLLQFNLPHFSAYCLSYEPGTRLYAVMTAGHVTPADDAVLSEMYTILCREAADAGYEHYEISNFAKPGWRSKHNSSYWHSIPYLGLGPGAHSFDGSTRRYNKPNLKAYLKSPDDFAIIDPENEREAYNDLIITSLRTSDGLDLNRLSESQRCSLKATATPWLQSNDLYLNNYILKINEQSWFISDSILRDLIVVD